MLTFEEKGSLGHLARIVRDLDFDATADGIEEYVREDGSGWPSPIAFLAQLRTDLHHFHYRHAGDEEDQDAYEAVDRKLQTAIEHLKRRRPVGNPPRQPTADRLVVVRQKGTIPAVALESPNDAAIAAVGHIGDLAYEVFLVLYLDVANIVIGYEDLTADDATGVQVNTASLVRNALLSGAVGIITAHQHPSGVFRPSSADYALWANIREQAKVMGITVLDNFVVTRTGFFSQREGAYHHWQAVGLDPAKIGKRKKGKR